MNYKFLILLVSAFYMFSCLQKNSYYTFKGAHHTYFKITYEYAEPLDKELSDIFNAYYKSINPFDSTSIISKVNNNSDVILDFIFINSFYKSQSISNLTNGYFDITCAPLLNYWGFGTSKNILDDKENKDIDSLLNFVGYEKISLSNGKIIKEDPRVLINFSAIGDGCICDLVGDFLDSIGVENYMIDIGGELLVKGKNDQNKKWSIGITKPDDNMINQSIYCVLETDQRLGVATSGDYRNYYIKDGKKYAHTINPKTGYPAAQDILSATVVYKECLIADGIATAIMSMGRKEFDIYKERFDFVEYLIIYSDENGNYATQMSSGMKSLLRKDNLSILYDHK